MVVIKLTLELVAKIEMKYLKGILMQQVTLAEAAENLDQFINAAIKGEEIITLKDKQPVVKLIAVSSIKRYPAKAGSAKGLIWMSDDFDEPLEDFKEYME